MLVEDHEILHRDISWTNVLIDAMHSDKHKHDNFRGRPFIDAVLGVGYIFFCLDNEVSDSSSTQGRSKACPVI